MHIDQRRCRTDNLVHRLHIYDDFLWGSGRLHAPSARNNCPNHMFSFGYRRRKVEIAHSVWVRDMHGYEWMHRRRSAVHGAHHVHAKDRTYYDLYVRHDGQEPVSRLFSRQHTTVRP